MEDKAKTVSVGALQETETPTEGLKTSTQHSHSSTGTSLTRFLICMAPVMVSLPGSNESSIEQPATILQVLSQLNAPEENEKLIHKSQQKSQKAKKSTSQVKVNKLSLKDIQPQHNENVNDLTNYDKNNDHDDDDDEVREDEDDHEHISNSPKNLVSRSSNKNSLDKSLNDSPPSTTIPISTITKDLKLEKEKETKSHGNQAIEETDQLKDIQLIDDEDEDAEEEEQEEQEEQEIVKDNVLHIESHLIETLSEILPNKESVGIKELQPAEIELQIGCSKIETKDNVRSVIEVEPAELITKKQVEQILAKNDPLHADQSEAATAEYRNGEYHASPEDIEEVAKQLIDNIEEQVVKAFEENTYKGQDLAKLQEEIKTEKEREAAALDSFTEDQVDFSLNPAGAKLSQVVDQHLSEVTSILQSQGKSSKDQLGLPVAQQNLKLVTVPSPQTELEEAERKLFIDSLPALQGKESTEAEKLALDCKREYYQSLKKYLIQGNTDRPPRPLQTYRWEDLRRARERGGYPWTHLYKRPLGPDEEPEIVLMLRKSQEIRFLSESPKSNKKVRIDDQVLIQETHPYLQELSEEEEEDEEGHHSENHLPTHHDHENHSLHSESFSFISDSVLATAKSKAANRFNKVRRLFRRRRYGVRSTDDAQSLPGSFGNASSLQQSLDKVPQQGTAEAEPIYVHTKSPRCFPIMKKLKSMAERQKKRLSIKRIHLVKDDKVAAKPDEEPRIIRLKDSPKSQRSDIAHFMEKHDSSDDCLDIVELDESPSRKRLGRQENEEEEANSSGLVKPEEIIEINEMKLEAAAADATQQLTNESDDLDASKPPKKAPRLRREHVYEEIDHPDDATAAAAEELRFILDATSVEALKQSLATQDTSAVREVAASKNVIPLDRMGSSEEEAITVPDRATPERKGNLLLAPISSIDSASSDEDRARTQLPAVTEEEHVEEEEEMQQQDAQLQPLNAKPSETGNDIRTALKKESSPAPSDKKVTFSHIEDEADPHREDVELSAEQLEAAKEANRLKNTSKKFSFIFLMQLLLTLRYRAASKKHKKRFNGLGKWLRHHCLCPLPNCCK